MSPAPPRSGDAVRVRARAPEPAGLWIRYAPRAWPAPEVPWLDLGGGRLEGLEWMGGRVAAGGGASQRLLELSGGPFDDLVWLPPVPQALRVDRDRLVERLLAVGTPVLIQALPGESPAAGGATVVFDLTRVLLGWHIRGSGAADPRSDERGRQRNDSRVRPRPPLADLSVAHAATPSSVAGDADLDDLALVDRHPSSPGAAPVPAALDALDLLPPGAAALWPLVAGLTDAPDLLAAGLDRLAAAGVAVVQPFVPRLDPAGRRRLAEAAGGDAFDRLFHGSDADERAFARAAAARGLGFLLPRPLPRPPLGGAANRRLAAALAVAGELWLRLGRTPSQGQAFFRAARWADETGYDLPALAREGHLGVVEAVDAASRALIEEAAATGGEPALVAELTRAYLAEEERDAD